MTALWNKTLAWLPQWRREERALDEVVAAAQKCFAGFQSASADALKAEAERISTAKTGSQLAISLGLFAAASQRALGWTPFEVQLRAAAAMTLGFATEMQTGEGKTLAVAAAATALALQNRRVHVATVNQYLSDRDYGQFAPVMHSLGISAGLLDDRRTWEEKRKIYGCRIVYGTGYAFGFDYLREQLRLLRGRTAKPGDRLRRRIAGADQDAPYQPPLDCTIVDELDSVVLDEAGVPLILSEERSARVEDFDLVDQAAQAAGILDVNTHFALDTFKRTLALNASGLKVVASHYPRKGASQLHRPWRQYVEDALTAIYLLHRDIDYVVSNQRVWIVDASTGRIFDDRRWPEGLQRAVEYRERVPFSSPTIGAARITRQRFFRLYAHFTGTSGTLVEARDELAAAYKLKVCVVPPRLPSQLVKLPPRCFRDAVTRNRAVVAAAQQYRRQGRPVLIGCRSIKISNDVSQFLSAADIAHQVLNGTQSAEESQLVRQAGRSGNVLVATNLAGRGTDIRLDDAALRAGGLHILGVEFHESPRIDRQLLGRAGRQGDPGSGQFFISADDSLWRSRLDLVERIRKASDDDGEVRKDLSDAIRRCREEVEGWARWRRREVSAFDGWLDDILETLERAE